INHEMDHGETDEGAVPDFVIDQMTELMDILQAELKRPNPVPQHADATPCPVRALLFDAGDVLYYRAERGRFFTEFLEELGINPEQDHAAETFSLRQQAYCGQIEQEEFQEAVLHQLGITQPDQVLRGLEALEKDEKNVRFFVGVAETLIALKETGFLLGIVTDTANPLHAKLSWFERGGFGHVWDSFTSSKDVGIRKPDSKIYCAALEQLGVSADQAVFVGHKASELGGATDLGIKTIAFNYDEDSRADYFVENFADILKVPIISWER
ncbi:MAG: HAD family hydrolase, partial [Anaerolineales bacterium]